MSPSGVAARRLLLKGLFADTDEEDEGSAKNIEGWTKSAMQEHLEDDENASNCLADFRDLEICGSKKNSKKLANKKRKSKPNRIKKNN